MSFHIESGILRTEAGSKARSLPLAELVASSVDFTATTLGIGSSKSSAQDAPATSSTAVQGLAKEPPESPAYEDVMSDSASQSSCEAELESRPKTTIKDFFKPDKSFKDNQKKLRIGAPKKIEEGQLIVTIDGQPSTLSKQEHARRLKSATLWLHHLQQLEHVEEVRESAVKIALCCDDCRQTRSQAHVGITELRIAAQVTCDALRQAIPASKSTVALAELKELWTECDQADAPSSATEIRAMVRHRLLGKNTLQQNRRKALNVALHFIKLERWRLKQEWEKYGQWIPSQAGKVS